MLYHNIARSGFRRGEYVGYDATGARWQIRRDKGARYWRAVRQTTTVPGGFLAADTLRELSALLETTGNRADTRVTCGALAEGGTVEPRADTRVTCGALAEVEPRADTRVTCSALAEGGA